MKKHLELITEMAAEVGYGKAISHLDVDRVYSPTILADQNRRVQEIAAELLRVLKATGAIQAPPSTTGSSTFPGTDPNSAPSKLT